MTNDKTVRQYRASRSTCVGTLRPTRQYVRQRRTSKPATRQYVRTGHPVVLAQDRIVPAQSVTPFAIPQGSLPPRLRSSAAVHSGSPSVLSLRARRQKGRFGACTFLGRPGIWPDSITSLDAAVGPGSTI
eukprot:3087570-Rhodomonas_salina.1